MPFLSINGWEIPVQEVTEESENIGGSTRTLGGNLIGNYLRKRKWRVTTTIMHPDDAKTLKLILASAGDHWGFDNLAGITTWDNNISNFLVSDKGLVASSGVATYRPFEGPNYLHAIAIEKGTTNILPDINTMSFETDLNAWTRYSEEATFLNPSDGGYHGTKYLRVAWSGHNFKWGIETTVTHASIVPGANITFSWYDRHSDDLSSISGSGNFAPPAIIFLRSDDTEISRATLTNLGGPTKNIWHRRFITATVPDNTSKVRLRIGFDEPNISWRGMYDIDAVQLEISSIPTSFTTSTRSANYISIPNFTCFNPKELTLAFSVYFLNEKLSTASSILKFYGNTLYPTLWIISYGNLPNLTLRIYGYTEVNTTFNFGAISYIEVNTWNKICMVFNADKQVLKVFQNGEKISEFSIPVALHPNVDSLQLGDPDSHSTLLSNLTFLPFAVPDSTAIALTSSSVPVRMPYVTISGDMVGNETVYCFPEVEDTEYIYYSHAGVWTKGERISFTLTEV